ncbi:uncharacterized protein LOC143343303 isoform X1 [Colletes latitarsis]|uniref:uncharacterized protein LOC143343303 isoform X1 n=1 Tax=Colletes latitarsis TaxID=2605962 RepID=UPI0040372E28
MPSTKDPFGEDASLLYPDNRNRGCHGLAGTHFETPIIKGVISQLRRWPTDLFYAFLAACLIIGSLVLLIFFTMVICLPTAIGNRCRLEEISIIDIKASPNVYFFKLENHNWSTREFCYIETAARRHPDLNVYLINLLKEQPFKENSTESIANKTRPESKLNDSIASNHLSKLTPEEQFEEQLVFGKSNIKRINVPIDKFFRGTKLSHIAKHLNNEVLEMAAKAQLLWTVPGIALKPEMYCALDTMKRFLCNRNKDECLLDTLATIELETDIQLTGVPCQAFMGFLVQEISRNDFNGGYTLMEAVRTYCPRLYYCPEIRILDSKTKCSTESLDCPIVYSNVIAEDNLNLGNFIT